MGPQTSPIEDKIRIAGVLWPTRRLALVEKSASGKSGVMFAPEVCGRRRFMKLGWLSLGLLQPPLLLYRSVVRCRLDSCSRGLNRLMQFLAQNFWWRQDGEVFGDVDSCGAELQQFDLLAVLASAQDNSQRQVLSWFALVLR
jgi:hypothetical protein